MSSKAQIFSKLKNPLLINSIFQFDSQTPNSLKLYLHLKGPSLISVIKFWFMDKEKKTRVINPANLQSAMGNRQKHWIPYRNGDTSMKEHIRAVAESSYVFIKFPEDKETVNFKVVNTIFF